MLLQLLYTRFFARSHFRGWPSVRENNVTTKSTNWKTLRKVRLPIIVSTEAYKASDLSLCVTCTLSWSSHFKVCDRPTAVLVVFLRNVKICAKITQNKHLAEKLLIT